MKKIAKNDFVFKKHMSVGEADAENDKKFLEDCFVDIGDYEILEDTDSPQSIVLGRTGHTGIVGHTGYRGNSRRYR